MVDAKERDAQRGARTLLTKHGLDICRTEVSVLHGLCTIRGVVTAATGWNIPDVEGEVQRVAHLIRQKPGIRTVVVEITTR